MRTYWQLGLALCLGFVFHLKSSAQEPVNLITARITTVKESDWQREMAQAAKPDGLRERLQARTLVELAGAMTEDAVTLLSDGQERGFVTQWGRTKDLQGIEAKQTEKQLIGTEMRIERVPANENTQETRLRITLMHDLQPPQSQPMTYATAAVGAERDKRSVTAPRFERLRWLGEVVASPEERMIASFQSPQDAGTRIVVFLQGGGAAASKVMPAASVQQTIYRVTETDMLEWMLKTSPDDAAVAHHLEEAVAAGQASIISNASLVMQPGTRVEAQVGSEHWLPIELEQDFDRLYMLPVAFKPLLQGTLLDFNTSGPPDMKSDASTGAFNSTYAPRAPLAVKWPTSWLRAMDEKGTRSKALHGWMDWYDRFEEHRAGSVRFRSAAPHLVAMMPPADQVWGTDRPGRWLDVTVMQQPGWTAPPAAEASAASPRRMFIGIALDSDAAHALLAARKGGQDDFALLRDLLSRVREGKARVMTCALAAHDPSRCTQTSARLHAYPTEMPSIPSAWAEQPVGTQLEMEGELVSLTQHLAPPARTEWKLARDMPEAIMWEPRFRTLSMITSAFALTTRGTHLLAAADVPAVMTAADLPANETFLLFSHLDSRADAPAVAQRDFEIETLIFETSAQDAAAWQGVEGDAFESFSQQQLKDGRAKLQSHTLLRTNLSPQIKLAVLEEYQTATGFDPPTREAPFRMRPTALQTLPVGLQFEGELTADPDGNVGLNIRLQHSTAKPIEPGLEETLRISADEKAKYPGAKHEQDEWTETLHLTPGKFHRLLPPAAAGGKATTRIAFVRVRPAQ